MGILAVVEEVNRTEVGLAQMGPAALMVMLTQEVITEVKGIRVQLEEREIPLDLIMVVRQMGRQIIVITLVQAT
jgi:hypothetical protein